MRIDFSDENIKEQLRKGNIIQIIEYGFD